MFPVTMTRQVEKHMAPSAAADAMGVAPASRGLEDAAVEDIVTYIDGCACFVSAIIPDREADEGSAFAAPNKRIRQKSAVDSESESEAGEPDVSDDI